MPQGPGRNKHRVPAIAIHGDVNAPGAETDRPITRHVNAHRQNAVDRYRNLDKKTDRFFKALRAQYTKYGRIYRNLDRQTDRFQGTSCQ